jgi:hypothetical protein
VFTKRSAARLPSTKTVNGWFMFLGHVRLTSQVILRLVGLLYPFLHQISQNFRYPTRERRAIVTPMRNSHSAHSESES